MLRITLPANADLSIFDDVLRRDELVQMLRECGLDADKETLVVRAEKPVDLIAIVAEHIREQGVYPAGGVVEDSMGGTGGIVGRLFLQVANRGMIIYKDQGPELNLMDLKERDEREKADDERNKRDNSRYTVNRVVRPEDPQFFDQIDDWIKNTVLKGWSSVKTS